MAEQSFRVVFREQLVRQSLTAAIVDPRKELGRVGAERRCGEKVERLLLARPPHRSTEGGIERALRHGIGHLQNRHDGSWLECADANCSATERLDRVSQLLGGGTKQAQRGRIPALQLQRYSSILSRRRRR